MDDLARGEPLVEVAPAAQDEDPMPVVGKRPGVGSVAAGGVGREERQRVERDALGARTQDLGGPGQATAQQHEDIVMVRPEPAGQLPGTVRRPVGSVLHGAMVEGGP